MRTIGVFLMFLTILTLAWGGGAVTRKEDFSKYVTMLKSANAKERSSAALILGNRGAIKRSDVMDAVEPLKTMLQKDTAAEARAAAAQALGNISPDPKETVGLLLEALRNDMSPNVKIAAINALGQYSYEAQSALTDLRVIAKDKTDKAMNKAAVAAVKSISQKKQ